MEDATIRDVATAIVAACITTHRPPVGEVPTPPPSETPPQPGPEPRRYIQDVEFLAGDGHNTLRDVEGRLYATGNLDQAEEVLLEHGLEAHLYPMRLRYLDHTVWLERANDYAFRVAAWREAAWRVEVARRIMGRLERS